ncbi:kinase-like domain-containing protein [Aspergillus pseudoustus]|uniref:Kinase-like domain-containing protein n=1 Tax=Aspergillus pseudoustus TaxID=1810923 RepID=A0ABR4K2Y7_9EURO
MDWKMGNKSPSHIKRLSDGTHVHLFGSEQVGRLHRLFINLQHYILELQIFNRRSLPPEGMNEFSATNCFKEKYGTCENVIHYGCSTTVRLHCRRTKYTKVKQLYAVKVFHHYSERTISDALRLALRRVSCLDHPNIVQVLELLDDDRGEFCIVMEYCGAGDLHSMIVTSGKLGDIEANCFFKQLMRAISYIHDNGIAHQNLNPKDVLLTAHGAVKVAHFTWAQESMQRERDRPLASPESFPYQPPEAISARSPDPRAGDIWASALIYMAMKTGHFLWNRASEQDREFKKYLCTRTDENGYPPIQRLSKVQCSYVIYAMLHPEPLRRLSAREVIRSEWLSSVIVCDAGNSGM